MGEFSALYFFRNNKRIVVRNLETYLIAQIYSPMVLRCAQKYWDFLSMPAHESVSDEIRDLICLSPDMTDKELQSRLNEIYVRRGIEVLSGYQDCLVPLSQDTHVLQTKRNLLSQKGMKVLTLLENADSRGHYTNQMAKLAMRAGNKQLLDLDFFKPWYVDKKLAKLLIHTWPAADHNSSEFKKYIQDHPDAATLKPEKDPLTRQFPVIQLSQGCTNGCSHCMCRAQGPISHMPYPVFLGLHRSFFKHYKKYPVLNGEGFWRFFYDSDTLDYQDPIIGADSGDVAMRLKDEGATFLNFTKGINHDFQRLALAKGSWFQPTHLSFVDTPDENMDKNMRIFQRTIRVLENTPSSSVFVLHHHLKTGPTVNLKKYTSFPIDPLTIYAVGRAKHFLPDQVRQFPDELISDPWIIKPNGDLKDCEISGGEHCETKCWNCFDHLQRKRSLYRRVKKFFSR